MEMHPEEGKIQTPLGKIRNLDSNGMHTVIICRAKGKPDCTCFQAMANMREEVVRRHPNSSDSNKNARMVKQTATKKASESKAQKLQPPRG